MRAFIAIFLGVTIYQWNVVHGFRALDIFNTAKNVTAGVIDSIPNIIPTPSEVFDASKQVLAGYPLEIVTSAINQLCSQAINVESITPRITPDINNMSLILLTETRNYSHPLTRADELWQNPAFDNKKQTVILVTGWTTTADKSNEALQVMSKAYLCRGNTNFVALDAAKYVDTLYTWSALNTEEIGESLGSALVKLVNYVPLENIHLIGHSLGAHIVGTAGRTFLQYTEKEIPRITGLDPAKPCFNEGEELTGIQRGDAAFIDIIHSNPGILGKRPPSGDVDFYAGGLSPLPNGCISPNCAHERAWRYYSETVYPGNEDNFLGVKCTSLARVDAGKCNGKPERMGYAVSKNINGNYFLDVNSESPFGMNAPSSNQSQICHNGISIDQFLN